MATGYYDAEGVWIYGESDSIALFSDLLNLGENSVSDQFTLDRSRLTALETVSGVRYAAASSTARDAHFGVPANDTQRLALQNSGAECIRTDLGYAEVYYATYNASTNPGGATPAGWYPAAGSNVIGALVRNSTAVSITTGTYTNVTSGYDAGVAIGMTVTGGTTGTITVPYTGWYQVTASCFWSSGATGTYRYIFVTRNKATAGAVSAAEAVTQNQQATSFAYVANNIATGMVRLTAGDVLRVMVLQNSGATLTLNTNADDKGTNTGLQIQYVGVQR